MISSVSPVTRAADAAAGEECLSRKIDAIAGKLENAAFERDVEQKKTDDVLWFHKVGDIAVIDKVRYTGPPDPRGEETYGIANARHPFVVWAYVFVPRGLDRSLRHPVLLFPHGGVHASFDTQSAHIVRELMLQGYVVIAPEYRGSTGYGEAYHKAIDYGGLEVDDIVEGRNWAVAALPFVDPDRVGIIGWSHGGLIALLAAERFPEMFKAVYAGVPVTDLIARLGYSTQDYRDLFSAPYHIGKTPHADVAEYQRRSPIYHVDKISAPLLIHSTTNDRDVHVLEVEHLIQALKAAGKRFEHRIYVDAPGGHAFNRIDTPAAVASRKEIYAFLAKHLRRRAERS
ncbi:alpha/beta fold hydrolase [Sorangium sp. So ce1504]|uniref:alpha/beta hydrolase family protein n=1 Tax=Sorangium sp. So ce1504 TaxID=3133337 RepID=UPI003F5D7434